MGFTEPELFRRTIDRFATGVTLITAREDGREYGVTARSVSSLSSEPPMLVVCVDSTTWVHDAIRATDALVVNVLAFDQQHLARRFAEPASLVDHSDEVTWEAGLLGVPVITGALAHFECRVTDRLLKGTHTVFLTDVVSVGGSDRPPLLSYRGQLCTIERT